MVYRRFGVSPRRQVPGWEMLVAAVEVLAIAALASLLYRFGDRTLAFIIPMLAVSPAFDFLVRRRQFNAISPEYDATAYRNALAEAEDHRTSVFGVILRATALLPVLAMVVLSMAMPPSYFWMGWAGTGFYTLYASKFFLRACEPPHPDEGDYFTLQQAS